MSKEKILIIGVSGMAGHVIFKYLSDLNKHEIIGTARSGDQEGVINLDVTNFSEVETLIHKIRPNYIVNAVGILIHGSKNSISNAILINSYFPHFLEKISKMVKAKLIHISTDCVFSGMKGGYTEDSFRDADDVYGRSKALGEIINENDITIRTSIIGPELKNNGEGLFHWFMSQKGEINGFNNVYWSGVTTLELAKGINLAIENNITGLLHLTNGENISKYHLVKLFKKVWNKKDIIIKEKESSPKDKSFVNTKFKMFNVNSSYETMLVEMMTFMKNNDTSFNYSKRYSL